MEESTTLIVQKLNAALEADGDFPTRANIVTELRAMTSNINTPVENVVELVMCEPSLATRLLHLTNSVYFGRASEIKTLSQAVTQLGLNGVYNLCANFVLLQKFSRLTEKSSAFANCFLISLLTSNIASYIDAKNGKDKEEEGYLSGSLFSIGPLLLGYYFPKLFNESQRRAERKKIGIFKAVEEILGIPANGISLKILDALSIPNVYKEILTEAFEIYLGNKSKKENSTAKSVCLGAMLAEAIIDTSSPMALEVKVKDLAEDFYIDYSELFSYLTKLPSIIHTQKTLLNSASCEFPEHFVKYIKGETEEALGVIAEENTLSPYLTQLETAIIESETLPSIIATVMEALSFACEFERVLYMEADLDRKNLIGKVGLGDECPDVSQITRSLAETAVDSLELKAFKSGMVETIGKPLFENSWPYVAIPVGYDERALGVIYADFNENRDEGLSGDKTISLTLIADILDAAIEKSRI